MKIDVSPGDGHPSQMVLGGLLARETLLPECLRNGKAGSATQQPQVNCCSLEYKLPLQGRTRSESHRPCDLNFSCMCLSERGQKH